jgi:hypothetical protein
MTFTDKETQIIKALITLSAEVTGVPTCLHDCIRGQWIFNQTEIQEHLGGDWSAQEIGGVMSSLCQKKILEEDDEDGEWFLSHEPTIKQFFEAAA